MSEKDKNRKDQLSDFTRYRGNEMTDKERNAFERELQKDLFAEEASEGFKETDAGLAENDILKLRKLVKRRTSSKQRAILLRIAASVAVLLVLSSILIIINRNKSSEQIAYSPVSPPAKEIQVAPEQKKVPDKIEINEPAVVIQKESKQVQVETQKPEIKPGKKDEIKEEAISADNQDAVLAVEAEAQAEAQVQEEPVISERAMASKSVLAKGIRGVEFEKEDTVAGHIPPQPVSGRADFDKYIQNNIRRPDTTTTGQRVVVVLDFIVKTDGIIDSIRIIRSPGKSFSDEAVRLIREGPPWKPAEENGKVISDEVRIRIVFK